MPGGIPICIYEPELGKFRVVRTKGKALSSGGYGVTWSRTTIAPRVIPTATIAVPLPCSAATSASGPDVTMDCGDDAACGKKHCSNTTMSGTSTGTETEKASHHTNDCVFGASGSTSGGDRGESSSRILHSTGADTNKDPLTKKTTPGTSTTKTVNAEYLFIEEVLFLHERGLIQALQQSNSIRSNGNSSIMTDEEGVLDTRALYEIMLHQLHMPLMVYLTYSHLRSQTFIVLRHTVTRYELLKRLQSTASTIAIPAPSEDKKKEEENIVENKENSTDVMVQTRTLTTAVSENNSKADAAVQDNVHGTDDDAIIRKQNVGEETKTNEKKEDRTNLSSSADEDHRHKDGNNNNYDGKKVNLPVDRNSSIRKRQKVDHPRRQLRQDIFEAPIPPVYRSAPPTTATKSDVQGDSNGTSIDGTAAEKDHRLQRPPQNNDAGHATTDAELTTSTPLHQNDHDRDAVTPTSPTDDNCDFIAFDVYNPNSQFRKTNPGLPDFYVALTSYDEPSPLHSELLGLIRGCRGVPLRMATVANGGTVVMFGMTDFGVPSIT